MTSRKLMATCAVAALAVTLYGCSDSSDENRLKAELDEAEAALAEALAELEPLREAEAMREQERAAREQEEQARMDAMTSAGLPGGLARSPAPKIHATSADDTLAALLPAGDVTFAPISAAVILQQTGLGKGTREPELGSAYVKAIKSDGEGGFHLTYVLDGEEEHAAFPAEKFFNINTASGHTHDLERYLWSGTDSFNEDDRTDGTSYYDYLDTNGFAVTGGPRPHGYEIMMVYGAQTPADSRPLGTASYDGWMSAKVYISNHPGSGSWVWGPLTLEADLDQSSIAGRMDVSTAPFNGGPVVLTGDNAITFSGGTIDASGFGAAWTGSGPADAPVDQTLDGFTGHLAGDFFGPAGEEVGGVLSGSREAGIGHDLIGSFAGGQQVPEAGE